MFEHKTASATGQGNVITANTTWLPSERVQHLLNDHNHARPSIGIERAIHYTEFHKDQAKQHTSPHLLNAHCLAYHLQNKSISIFDRELIVGSHTEHRIGAICQVERSGVAMLEDLFSFEKRQVNPLHFDKKHRWNVIRSVIPYWLNRNLATLAFQGKGKLKHLKEIGRLDQYLVSEAGGIAHFIPDFGMLIQKGTVGLRARIKVKLDDASISEQQTDYLKANLVALDALDDFADRHLALAKDLGREDLVAVLEQVPRRPARTVHEALQMIWFFQLIIQIESMDQGISLGRVDQYLFPLLQAEREQGLFDANFTRELIAALCIKLSEVIPLFSARATKYLSGLPSGQALTLGGIDQQGQDASNELTYLFLDVLESVKTRQPNWHARISHTSRPNYLTRLFDIIKAGGGSPALYNDDAIMPAMGKRQADPGLLWDYGTVGCVEPAIQGISFTSSDAALVNVAINLELVLGGGKALLGDKSRRRPYLDNIHCIDDLLEVLRQRVDQQIDGLKYNLDQLEIANANYFPTPFSSLTVQGCLESATDLTEGGATYNASGIQGVGIADVADSLAVIDALVFTSEQHTLEDVANACACNFENLEMLRAQALKIPKFGNDDPAVDIYMEKVTEIFDKSVSRHTNTRGGRWMPGFYSMTCHRGFGELTSALPSGRLAGESLADGLAPSDGSDRLGPTASLNSVASLDHQRFGNGINLNLKFDSNTLKGNKGRDLLGALVKGYFNQGGMQVQVNVLDVAVLQAARAHPEKYRNLLVRISGYSAYFVDLTPAMQQEIINRTQQQVS
jgi:pyruvate formate-lyase/glycerol dehydratase family glycyl radical enzyme